MSRLVALTLALALLVACTSELGTFGEPLRILGSGLPEAFIGESYIGTIQVAGGLRPFTFAVDAGELPPGLVLQGGSLRGTPEVLGTFTFTVTVSDANLAKTFQSYTLVVADIPPPQLSLNPPPTEVQTVTTLRGIVDDARGLTALRTVVRWDSDRFALVPASVAASRPGTIVFFEERPGEVQVDVAFANGPVDGRLEAFRLELTPTDEPSNLQITFETEFLSGSQHHFRQQTEGQPPAPDPSNDEEEEEEEGAST